SAGGMGEGKGMCNRGEAAPEGSGGFLWVLRPMGLIKIGESFYKLSQRLEAKGRRLGAGPSQAADAVGLAGRGRQAESSSTDPHAHIIGEGKIRPRAGISTSDLPIRSLAAANPPRSGTVSRSQTMTLGCMRTVAALALLTLAVSDSQAKPATAW